MKKAFQSETAEQRAEDKIEKILETKAANVNVTADPVEEETSVEKKDITIPVEGKSNLNSSSTSDPQETKPEEKAKSSSEEKEDKKAKASLAKEAPVSLESFTQDLKDFRK